MALLFTSHSVKMPNILRKAVPGKSCVLWGIHGFRSLYKTLFLLVLIVFLFQGNPLFGNSKPAYTGLPAAADISVIGIFLLDSKSAEKYTRNEEITRSSMTGMEYTQFYNPAGDQVLTLILHPGREKNDVSEVQITEVNKKFLKPLKIIRGIKHFVTGKGIRIGVSEDEVLARLGNPAEGSINNDETVFKYVINNFETSSFLQYYNMPVYYGEYTFYKNRLVDIRFGFEYP